MGASPAASWRWAVVHQLQTNTAAAGYSRQRPPLRRFRVRCVYRLIVEVAADRVQSIEISWFTMFSECGGQRAALPRKGRKRWREAAPS
jgi:hypothetical protein